jgi:hypothetical protein
MFHKLLLTILLTSAICYGQYDTIITIHRDTVNDVNKYDTLIYPQLSPVSAPSYQFTYNRKDTNNAFNQTMWYDGGRNALWFKKDATKKYNLLASDIYDSLFNYLNNKSAYGYLGEGTDNYLAKFTTTSQTAVIPVMTSNTAPTGQTSDSHGGNAYMGFNETIKNYSSEHYVINYSDHAEWNSGDADSLTAWLIYKFPTQRTITKYIVGAGYWLKSYEKSKQAGGTFDVYKLFAYPTAWSLLGSNDSTTWIRIDSCVSQNFGGAVDTTGGFVNGYVNSYTLTPVNRTTFTNQTNIANYLYYKIQFTAFYSGSGIDYNTNSYYKIMIGSIQMYEGASVNFANSKIYQSAAGDTITADAIVKTTQRAEIGGTVQANGMIIGLKDGLKLYDTNTPYKYNLFETYGQTTNNYYRMPQALPTANQYLKALLITGSDPYYISLGWGTDAVGSGSSVGGDVWKGGDTTVNKLTKWSNGHTVTGSNFNDDGTVPRYNTDTLATRAWHRANDLLGSVGSGEANTYSTVGGSLQWTKTKVGVDLPFKGVTAGTGISITDNTTYLTINATSGTGVSGREVKSAVLPLYKTNDTTITIKGLTSLGIAGQVMKVNSEGTALEWGNDLQTAGGSGGQVYKIADTTAGYLTKWYDGHTIRGSLFSETASAPFWNGDTLIRSTYYRLHDRNHNIISEDHNDGYYGAYVNKVLKVGSGGYLTWGTDSVGAGGGSGDLTGTGITSTYVKNYSNWTGAKTLGYIGSGMGLRDSATSGGAHFSLVPSLIAQGAYPKYYGDSLLTPNYYKLHQHWGTSNRMAYWNTSNTISSFDNILLNESGGLRVLSGWLEAPRFLFHEAYNLECPWEGLNIDTVLTFRYAAPSGTDLSTDINIRLYRDGKIYGRGTDGTLGYFLTVSSSDQRLKDSIKTLTNSADKLKQLRGVSFIWNEKGTKPGKAEIGVIAQEIEKIIPTAVIDRGDGYKAVMLDKVIPILIETNKEMLIRIEYLESAIRELQNKIK